MNFGFNITYPLTYSYGSESSTSYWFGLDDEENFIKNKQRFGDKFGWSETDITYSFNSNNMRCDELKNVDISDSYIIVGCSHVLGVGQKFEDTIGEQLSCMLGKRVLNAGQVAAGNDAIFLNAIWANNLNPLGVIVLWSHYSRFMFYADNHQFEFIGGNAAKFNTSNAKNYIKKEYRALSSDLVAKSVIYRTLAENMKHVYAYNMFDSSMNDYVSLPSDKKDFARDMLHFGKLHNNAAAEYIYKDMTK